MAAGMYMDTRLQQQFWGNPYWQSDLYEPPPPTPNPHPPIGRLARPGLLVIPPIVPAPLTPTPVVLMREIERYNKKRNAERAERLAAAQPADRPAGPPVRPRRRRIWDDMFFDDLPPTPPPRRASAPAPVARVTPSQPLNELTAPAPSIAAPAPVSRVAPLQPLKELNGVISDSTKKAPLPLPLAASNVNVSVEGSAKVSAKASKLLPVSAKQLSFRTWLGDDENATTTATAVRPSCVCETALQQSSDASRLAELRIDIPSLGAAAAIGAAVPTGSSCAELGHATAGHASLQELLVSSPGTTTLSHAAVGKKFHRESSASSVDLHALGSLLCSFLSALKVAAFDQNAVTAGLKDMLLVEATGRENGNGGEKGGERETEVGVGKVPPSLHLQPHHPLSPLIPLQSPLSSASVQALPPMQFQAPFATCSSRKVDHPGRYWSPLSVLNTPSYASDASSEGSSPFTEKR